MLFEEEAKILDKIEKLRRLAKGNANEHEAEAAWAKIRELEAKLNPELPPIDKPEPRYSRVHFGLTEDDIELLNGWKAIADRWRRVSVRINQAVEHAIETRNMEGLYNMPAFAFDGSGIAPEFGGGGQQLPEGKHPVRIVKTSIENTKDGKGGMLVALCEAFDGPAKGVQMPIRFNMHNQSAAAVEIAKKQLTAVSILTTGRPGFNNTEELHDKPFVVDVRKQANNDKYHEIFEVYSMDGKTAAEVSQNGGGNNNGGANAFGGAMAGDQQQGGGNGGQGGGQSSWQPNAGNGGGGNQWGSGGNSGGDASAGKGPWG